MTISNFAQETQADASTSEKPVVIGLYGLPGSGKSFLLNQLKEQLPHDDFDFYEGSKKIADLVPGGLAAFQEMDEQEKFDWRRRAIDAIGKDCIHRNRVAIVTGHFMFWPEKEAAGRSVYTSNDLDTFTHIIYLDVPADCMVQRRLGDKQRSRPSISIEHLCEWQQVEKAELRYLCRHHNILFSVVPAQPTLLGRVSTLIRDFQQHTVESNLTRVHARLNELLFGQEQLETVLVIDADKTLAEEDTGTLFWDVIFNSRPWIGENCPLKALFSSPLGYSETAFRQATLLYEEVANDRDFDAFCDDVALAVRMHPEFLSLLRLAATHEHIGVVVVTCGLRRVWEKVMEREGLFKTVKVIGGGRISDGFVVTPSVKAAIVAWLRDSQQTYVWAFGDSPLDLPMLGEADEAIVVVGDERTRSHSMDAALLNAIDSGCLQARQALLPANVAPRLEETRLPQVCLNDHDFIESIIRRRGTPQSAGSSGGSDSFSLRMLHATDRNAAKLLMTPTRDATVAGPTLRKAHHSVGRYLATEFLSKMIGVEEYSIPHVQGHQTSGYRLRDEHQTSIVALMRGGEAMAFGVSEAFPCAMFIHAASPTDVKHHHLQNQRTVVLVDSVINSGKTVIQFVEHIRKLHASIHIVVLAGVVQAGAVSKGHALSTLMSQSESISLIALRLSENKFTGTKTTDTGNRLFNTTHLP